jgi:hypothetical protein
MPNYFKTALYFEERANGTRRQDERERLLAVARKYRELAVDKLRPKRPNGPPSVANDRT